MKPHDWTPARPSSARLQPKLDEQEPTARLAAGPEPTGDRGGPVEPEDDYIGQLIDNRYVVEAVIGQGGMGVVYQCRHRVIGKKLAMKIIRAEMAGARDVTQRFLLEAKAASAIGSEHITHVSDFGQLPDGASYLVMELLDGRSLAAAFREHWPLPVPRIVSILSQLADGLGAAHQAGIVHRDLKPENIFLVRLGQEHDFVKILDFGIAKMNLGNDAQLTQAGTVVGTPRYMSPEQAAGAVVDQRGDIYSLGVLLYELIAGHVPFDGEHPLSIMTQQMYAAPPAFDALSPSARVPAELERIVWKCLAKRPEERYGSMEELAIELRRIGSGSGTGSVSSVSRASEREGTSAQRPSAPTEATPALSRLSAAPLPRRWVRLVMYCAFGLLLVVVGSVWLLGRGSREPALTPAPPSAASPPVASAPAPAAEEPASSAAERAVEPAAEPVPLEAPPAAAAAPGAALGPDPKAARRPASKPRPRRDRGATGFVNPWPAQH